MGIRHLTAFWTECEHLTMLESDLTFPRNYVVDELGELPGTGTLKMPLIYFPTPKGRPEHNGEWLKSWVGVFAFGPGSRTAVISTPEPNTVCVISKGEGYMVHAESQIGRAHV